jgi:lipopolysaccharide transport system ATP-binding protein
MAERDLAIDVENVAKRYRLGAGAGTLAERVGDALRLRLRRPPGEDFWALRDVSMHVSRGEVVGVIGQNGAGKSTLLKLLSHITLPTEGRITLRGRVGSLLEVGTGFHPELTGRENVFLNGSILGMRRHEIAARFDEIVEFSGIERFIDTPVKRYSSGMYVRLAFAVAAHLDPEILLVDEVLAVGDIDFQRKCLGRLQSVAGGGRTVVFVSHNLSAVKQLCNRAYLLESGHVVAEGASDDVVARYLQSAGAVQHAGVATVGEGVERLGGEAARLQRVSLLDSGGDPSDRLHLGERFTVAVELDVRREYPDTVVELGFTASDGARVASAFTSDGGAGGLALAPGRHEIRAAVDAALLPGEFTLDVGLHRLTGETLDMVNGVLAFTVLRSSQDGADVYPWGQVRGSVRARTVWTVGTPSAMVPE